LRFRPILMTAFAFILGVVPLMIASGAGAGAQNVMGTSVFWGMLVATFFGVFLIPETSHSSSRSERRSRTPRRSLRSWRRPPHRTQRTDSMRTSLVTALCLI
jgi:hypothetical protein